MSGEEVGAWGLASVGAVKGVFNEFIRPNPSLCAWAVLGASVVAYDLLAPPGHTMSEAVDRALEKNRLLTLGAVAIVAGHLTNVLPEGVDPLHYMTRLGRNYGRTE